MRTALAAFAVGLTFSAPPARAAAACSDVAEVVLDEMGTPDDDLLRVADLAGAAPPAARLIRRGGARTETVCAAALSWPGAAFERAAADVDGTGPEIRRLPLRLTSVWNSTYPSGENDGLLWAGRGLSQQLSTGVALRRGPFSAALAPAITWSENRAFDLVPNGGAGDERFGNPYYSGAIDLPQRFGVGPFATWSPGQSYLRADAWNLALGISSESLWFGPGIRNSLLMSNAGPGFPHVFLGTSRPADIWIGKAEALLFWGRLDRTRFIAGGGHPLIQGFAVTYSPRWIEGLTVGVTRALLQPWDGLQFRDYFAMFQSFSKKDLQSWYGPEGDNPFDNQIASVSGRWVFPEAGLEIYGELAREDHEWTWWGFIREPDHSQAYLLGMQKLFRPGARAVRLYAELTHLQEQRPLDNQRGVPVYYTHRNDLGYTNGGQLLGAWIGPGGDSQTLGVDVFHPGGRIGGYLERVRRNDAYYWAVIEPSTTAGSHDAELTGAVRQVLFAGPAEISWEAALSYRQNRDFIRHELNGRVALGIAVPFGGRGIGIAPQ